MYASYRKGDAEDFLTTTLVAVCVVSVLATTAATALTPPFTETFFFLEITFSLHKKGVRRASMDNIRQM
jgi:type IV secretory pathway TrbL component